MSALLRRAVLLAAALAALPAGAFDWPLEKIVVTGTFGESRGDHFHLGVDLGGGEQEIHPISPGEVVFRYDEAADYSSVPTGLGNFMVLAHQGGIRSLYAHMKDGTMNQASTRFELGESLGVVGDTGYSLGRHLHLTIIDSEMNTVINPLAVLPPPRDAQRPVVESILLREGGQLRPVSGGEVVAPGEVEVLAVAYDLRADVSYRWRMAPYRLSLYQNGREVHSVLFDSFREQSPEARESFGGTEVPRELAAGGESFDQIYAGEWLYRLGRLTLVPGESTLAVFVRDFAGNEASREAVIRVRER